jgi:long-chain acyl-CoA synthetase
MTEPVSLYEAFARAAELFPDKVAMKGDGGRGLILTYTQALDQVKRLAAGLQSPDLATVSEIGLLSENRPEWAIAYLAVVASGKTVVPLDANLKANEVEALVRHTNLKMMFVSSRWENKVAEFAPDIRLLSLDGESAHHWQSLAANPVDFTPIGSRDTTAALIYTSGTTGSPKAVILTHGNLLANMEAIVEAILIDERDVFLSVLPLHHTFEATCGFLSPLARGGEVVFVSSLKSKEVLEDISRNGITKMCGVPLLYEKMYHSIRRKLDSASAPRRALFQILFAFSALGLKFGWRWGKPLFRGLRRKAGLGSLRIFVSGAAALPPHVHKFFILLGFDFIQGYGMTETSPVISVQRPDDIRFGSVGPPLRGVEVRIDAVDVSGVGEIVVRGANCTPGYRDHPEQTAELWRDGWLHTGDLGHLEHGHIWITGRAKNLIVSAAGKNIYPEEIEDRLMTSDFVMEAVVFGRAKQGRLGEEVCAMIVPNLELLSADPSLPQGQRDQDRVREVIAQVVADTNATMAEYKRIVGFDLQFQELEKTSTKKVKRFVYR